MKIIKGFKLTNAVLLTSLTLAIAGCGDDLVTDTSTDTTSSESSDDSSDTSSSYSADEFTLISSSGVTSDVDYTIDYAVGTWSTSSVIDGDASYEGESAWKITSGSSSAEEGNWGTVLVFQDGIDGDFSLFNSIDLKIATSGGYDSYKLSLSGNGVGKEIILPVDDSSIDWQSISIDLTDFALNLSDIDYIAVMGVGGTSSVSNIYVTDYSLIKDSETTIDSETEDDFVFKSSDSSIDSSLFVDDDVTFGEWSTGTTLTDGEIYNDLDSWMLSTSSSWGSVVALTSSSGSYSTDFSEYTNLKLKVASEGDFSSYEVYIGSEVDDVSSGNAVAFSLSDQSEWNQIDIDLDSFGADLSNVSQVAVYGVYTDGTAASQLLYITDLIAYDTGITTVVDKDSSDDKFVFVSSSGEDVDIIEDGDNTVHEGNITVGEWSTGTLIESDVDYDGLNGVQLTHAGGWGAVLAMMGDTYGEVQSYDIDLTEYSTVNFDIAADGAFTEYYAYFGTTVGAEAKISLSVNSDWNEVSINLDDLPLDLNKVNQIVIYGVGGVPGDNIYITDFNIAK